MVQGARDSGGEGGKDHAGISRGVRHGVEVERGELDSVFMPGAVHTTLKPMSAYVLYRPVPQDMRRGSSRQGLDMWNTIHRSGLLIRLGSMFFPSALVILAL